MAGEGGSAPLPRTPTPRGATLCRQLHSGGGTTHCPTHQRTNASTRRGHLRAHQAAESEAAPRGKASPTTTPHEPGAGSGGEHHQAGFRLRAHLCVSPTHTDT
eukprot:COSAG01_NODE_29568_length_634_cov_3.031776_1_plen_102_part_10